MPSVSDKQHRFMEAVAHDPAFARKVDVSQSVGRDFVQADKNARNDGCPITGYLKGVWKGDANAADHLKKAT